MNLITSMRINYYLLEDINSLKESQYFNVEKMRELIGHYHMAMKGEKLSRQALYTMSSYTS